MTVHLSKFIPYMSKRECGCMYFFFKVNQSFFKKEEMVDSDSSKEPQSKSKTKSMVLRLKFHSLVLQPLAAAFQALSN